MLQNTGRVTTVTGRKGNQPRFSPRIGKPNLGIVSANRKTEICRNWQRGCCIYGAPKCAFAHGAHDLKHQSLDEMEHTGRIPNASKFRCYPCLTWVATGACPYFSRCVFLHDPRIRGPKDAWLYSNSQNRSGKGGGVGSPFGRDTFYWPDMPRPNVDDGKLPSTAAHYDLDASLLKSEDPTDRAVYHLWYSLVGTLMEHGAKKIEGAGAASGASSSSARAPFFTVGKGPSPTPAGNGTMEAGLERGRQQTAVSTADVVQPSVPCSWVIKNPERRLRVFKLLSQGQPVAPDYVPVPGPVGPLFRCDVCGLGPLLQHRVVAHPRKMRSPFPLSDIGSSSSSAHTPSANKPTRQKQAWKPDITGDENQRPHAARSSVRSDPLPRRSTASLGLGRVTGTRSRPFGCEVARGLFGGGATDRDGASSTFPVINDRVPLKRALGSSEGNSSRRPERRCGRSLSSPSISSIASLSTPFPGRTGPSSRYPTPTNPTASPSPSASSATSTTWASLSRTLSSSTPPSHPLGRADGRSAPVSEAVYPFGTFADGM